MFFERAAEDEQDKRSQGQMGAFFLIGRRIFFAQSQQRGDIGVGKLIDLGNRRPGLAPCAGSPCAAAATFFRAGSGPIWRSRSLPLDLRAAAGCGNWSRLRQPCLKGELLESLNISAQVGQIDPAAGFAAVNPGQIDAEFAGDFADRRSSRRRHAALRFVAVVVNGVRERSWLEPGLGGGSLAWGRRSARLPLRFDWIGLRPLRAAVLAVAVSMEISVWPTLTSMPCLT